MRASKWIAVAAVIAVYVFFATAGTMRFPAAPKQPHGWDNPGRGYYAQLAAGFLRGNTSLAVEPDARMATLTDPYDYGQRDAAKIGYLWDASYYRGRYYLYFTPLPVVLVYIPFRVLTGEHADDSVAGVLFSIWILVAAVLCLRRATLDHPYWIVFIGLANLLPFALSSMRVYEVAILCATAFSTSWAAALLRFLQSPSRRTAAWMTLWLALAIVARPNLIVLILPTVFVLLRQQAQIRFRLFVAASLPLCLAACAYMAYNVARFDSPLESGITYQLTYVSMQDVRMCSVCNRAELSRLVNNALQYQFTPPRFGATFPHASAATAYVDRSVAWPGGDPEEIIGMATLVPLTLGAPLFAALLLAARSSKPRALAGMVMVAGASLVLLALSTCWWIVSRYAFDFQILMTLGTILCLGEVLAFFAADNVVMRPLRIISATLALYSIVVCLLLGFEGRGGAFRARTTTGEVDHRMRLVLNFAERAVR